MGRSPCCEKIGLKKGPWTSEEDDKLASFIKANGHGSWRALPKKAGLLRCGKSCRLRWTNYLRPDIKRGEFSASEQQTIIQLHALLGNRWSAIANHLPKRTDNEIKNYWNTHLKKRLLNLGLDPATHKPKSAESWTASCGDCSRLTESPNSSHGSSSVSHMTQWESARLEAEARLAKESFLRAKGLWPSASSATSKPSPCDAVPPKPKHNHVMSTTQVFGGRRPSLLQKYEVGADGSCRDDPTTVPKGMSVNEIVNSLQNWEYSLQGQAGLMWPESWRSSLTSKGVCAAAAAAAAAEVQQESSACSSSPQEHLNHGSPTSTLCFLELSSKRALHQSTNPTGKLSWSDILSDKQPLISCRNDSVGAVSLDGYQEASRSQERGLPSLLSYMQDATEYDGSYVISTAEKRQGDSTTNSSSLLDELELVSEDISSAKGSCMVSCGEFGNSYWDNLLADCP